MQLTTDQAQRIERARVVLAEESPSTYEPADMAGRLGRLEWHVQELLSLIGEITHS
jgi:hypothetical protein